MLAKSLIKEDQTVQTTNGGQWEQLNSVRGLHSVAVFSDQAYMSPMKLCFSR